PAPCRHGHQPVRARRPGPRAAHPRPRRRATTGPGRPGPRGPARAARAAGGGAHRAGRVAARRAHPGAGGPAVIRPATPGDNTAIASIWNHEVLHTSATTDTEPRLPEAQRAW